MGRIQGVPTLPVMPAELHAVKPRECRNCHSPVGHFGHYVPPSFGEAGYFICPTRRN